MNPTFNGMSKRLRSSLTPSLKVTCTILQNQTRTKHRRCYTPGLILSEPAHAGAEHSHFHCEDFSKEGHVDVEFTQQRPPEFAIFMRRRVPFFARCLCTISFWLRQDQHFVSRFRSSGFVTTHDASSRAFCLHSGINTIEMIQRYKSSLLQQRAQRWILTHMSLPRSIQLEMEGCQLHSVPTSSHCEGTGSS